ncbi:MAG: carboxylesterase/lipase family protein [bacterium]|nr:carboxylesterase/lipase family protein [bacterium]
MTEVETSYGRLRGSETRGIRVFRGIRFARPPSGSLRFLPPHAPESWTGVRDARVFGEAAPQFSLPVFAWVSAAGSVPGDDCLRLNIWTPQLDGAKRPVMVWIHGGGYLVGAGSAPIYDGEDLARRGDVVVVTLNHRLGAIGYGQLGTLLDGEMSESTNLGVRDQIAALEWVNQNIERFGGDPGNVMLFGQSAGAMSVATLLGAPAARPLFQRAILQSGAADHVLDRDEAREVARFVISELGGPAPTADALGRIPLAKIMTAQRRAMARFSNLRRVMTFLPAVDGDVIPEQPIDAIRRGAASHIPIITGVTLDEWNLFRLIDEGLLPMSEAQLIDRFAETLEGEPHAPGPGRAVKEFRRALAGRGAARSPSSVWRAYQSSRVFHQPATRLAEAQTQAGGSVYSYLFTWRPQALRRTVGSCHALEIPFVFGSTQHPFVRPVTGFSASAGRLSRRMQHAWIEFARVGIPGHERLPEWPQYTLDERDTMIFGREPALEKGPLDPERRLLSRWLPAGSNGLELGRTRKAG